MTRNRPRQIGDWKLGRELGKGGNGTVWEAYRNGESPVALKVIGAKSARTYQYRRFAVEIDALREIDDAGVLPLLDAHLPESPTAKDPPWLAMPIAMPITDALAEAPFEAVVDAIATIAEVLVRLKETHDFAHRDIKPGNLYCFEGRWAIGDFGLVASPDAPELTDPNRPLGPRYFMASEMRLNPTSADPFLADVYSLAKTLWVLATGQNFPPEGHQSANVRHFSISSMRPHPNASGLDRLVDVCTHLDAANRPSVEQVAGDLRAWLAMPVPAGALEISQAARAVREKLQIEIDAEARRDQWQEAGLAAFQVFQTRLRRIGEALREARPNVEFTNGDSAIDIHLRSLSAGLGGQPRALRRWQWIVRIYGGEPVLGYGLRVGGSVELMDDGRLIIRGAIDVSYERTSGIQFEWHADPQVVPATTIAPESAVISVADEIEANLSDALQAFAEHLANG